MIFLSGVLAVSIKNLKEVINDYLNTFIDEEIIDFQEVYSWEEIEDIPTPKKKLNLRPRHEKDSGFWNSYDQIIKKIKKNKKSIANEDVLNAYINETCFGAEE